MGRIALGYGSEWQLLRYLGRHRTRLTTEVSECTGVQDISWLDFGFTRSADRESGYGDSEITGLNFLPHKHPARKHWLSYWPQTGNVQNWDAVGVGQSEGNTEWLLVEAKASTEEIKSRCQAKLIGGRSLIEDRLAETKAEMGVDVARNWMEPYYQYANRLATLRFLLKHNVRARLVFIYFTGDRNPRATCPRSPSHWSDKFADIKRHLGLAGTSAIELRTHQLVLPVVPAAL